MIASEDVKNIAFNLGVNLCGIASADRFKDAPEGFKPTDIYKKCRSVVVFAKRLPKDLIASESCVPYTHYMEITMKELDRIALKLSLHMEDLGVEAVPIPSDDPYEYWEADKEYGRGVLSLRHAGYLAGLGVLGKNTLLINQQYGNMICLGAVLASVDMESDPIVSNNICPDNCRLCINACPQKSLDGISVNQKQCRTMSSYKTTHGVHLMKCSLCRKVCPNNK